MSARIGSQEIFAAGKSLHLVHYVYFCPLRPLEVFRAFQPVPPLKSPTPQYLSSLCVRFFLTLRFTNARLRRINARYYTIALKALSVLSLFFIMNGSPLFAGPIEFAGGDGGSIESAVLIRGAKHESEGISAEHRYLSAHFGSWFLKRQALINQKGRVYDQMEITDQNGNQRLVYFDITDFFAK